jgi:cbb3-type cytochrome oxidase subunit 3
MINFIADNATIIGLIFFFSFFLGVVIWIMQPSQKDNFEKYSKIPLKD